jgi:hypothetical protein
MNYAERYIDAILAKMSTPDFELAKLYGLLAMTTGVNTTKKNVHDAWTIWESNREGGDSNHRSAIRFDELSQKVQDYDEKYMIWIHEVARELGES